jgi:hypothetical protein
VEKKIAVELSDEVAELCDVEEFIPKTPQRGGNKTKKVR